MIAAGFSNGYLRLDLILDLNSQKPLWASLNLTKPVRAEGRLDLEVPNPLSVEVCRGDAAIETVLNDIMALTKLNYNVCLFADGAPITLKFANAVGEGLIAGPIPSGGAPLPFMYYI